MVDRAESDLAACSEQASTGWLDAMFVQLAELVRERVSELEKGSEVRPAEGSAGHVSDRQTG
jgi:hypothetical protein